MRMCRITLEDNSIRELTIEEMKEVNLTTLCEGQKIINTEFFEETGK